MTGIAVFRLVSLAAIPNTMQKSLLRREKALLHIDYKLLTSSAPVSMRISPMPLGKRVFLGS